VRVVVGAGVEVRAGAVDGDLVDGRCICRRACARSSITQKTNSTP
jgi:hypothetical protein